MNFGVINDVSASHRYGHDGQRKGVAHMPNSDNNRSRQPIYNWAKSHPNDFTMR
jgi:hypothetical protein